MKRKLQGKRLILCLVAIFLAIWLVYLLQGQQQDFNGILVWKVQTYLPNQWLIGMSGIRIGQGRGLYVTNLTENKTTQITNLRKSVRYEILPTLGNEHVLIAIAPDEIVTRSYRGILLDQVGKYEEISPTRFNIVGADVTEKIVFLKVDNRLYKARLIDNNGSWKIDESSRLQIWRSDTRFQYKGGSKKMVIEEIEYIKVINSDDGIVNDIFNGVNAVCYKDEKILYRQNDWLIIYSTKSRQHFRLTKVPIYEKPIAWSPDGKYVLTVTSRIDLKRALMEIQTLQIRDSKNGNILWANSDGGWNISGAAWIL